MGVKKIRLAVEDYSTNERKEESSRINRGEKRYTYSKLESSQMGLSTEQNRRITGICVVRSDGYTHVINRGHAIVHPYMVSLCI